MKVYVRNQKLTHQSHEKYFYEKKSIDKALSHAQVNRIFPHLKITGWKIKWKSVHVKRNGEHESGISHENFNIVCNINGKSSDII